MKTPLCLKVAFDFKITRDAPGGYTASFRLDPTEPEQNFALSATGGAPAMRKTLGALTEAYEAKSGREIDQDSLQAIPEPAFRHTDSYKTTRFRCEFALKP